jgi:uncharacterized protein YqgC (DUF456 family)
MGSEILHWSGLILSYLLVAALAISGIIFSILPPIPGPLLTLAAMFVVQFLVPGVQFEPMNIFGLKANILWVMSTVTIFVLLVENLIPLWTTKKFGGTKAGVWGSTIGLLVGLFFLPAYVAFPLNLIFGLFLGAMIGELSTGKDMNVALKSGFGSFLGFLAGNGLKLAIALIMCVQMIRAIF